MLKKEDNPSQSALVEFHLHKPRRHILNTIFCTLKVRESLLLKLPCVPFIMVDFCISWPIPACAYLAILAHRRPSQTTYAIPGLDLKSLLLLEVFSFPDKYAHITDSLLSYVLMAF